MLFPPAGFGVREGKQMILFDIIDEPRKTSSTETTSPQKASENRAKLPVLKRIANLFDLPDSWRERFRQQKGKTG